ncbi:MAG: CRISPR-associated RAMP protein [Thermoanaerobacteraceae bacterium]|nr:CRISPR-associated RAMP protein [Thermoanaerobacteraceae bacterium]
MLFDKYYNKYIVKGILRTNTPLHIGAGEDSFNPIQADKGVIVDHNGKPYIPGSSLKGVLRTNIEIMVNSGIGSEDSSKSCLIVNNPCLTKEQVDKIKNKYKHDDNKDLKTAQEIYEEMCDVCKIFGSNYFASKLSIRDSTLKGEKAYIQKRDGVAIDRETGTAADNKKYDYEQVAAGAEFNFYMTVDNLDDELVDLFKLIINILASGELQLGGKTTYGLGRVQLIDYEIYKITNQNLKQYLLEGLSDEMRWSYV